ncbi:Leo1-like protein-domain-containing protein [Xylariaceae sp. FL0016]|nr:Leo1-like protein-domain-containing protein [Xylariaceae sp. FL0016]
MSDSDDAIDLPDEGGQDLFGDDGSDIDTPKSGNGRALSDKDLESDQDAEDREDREDEDATGKVVIEERTVKDIAIRRHKAPRTKSGLLQSLKVPTFLKFYAPEYQPSTFEPTEWDMENARSEKPQNVVRFQRDSETGECKSNANIYRWSDGSMTMSVGGEHYEVRKKMMIPPVDKPYEERGDAHYYAAAAHIGSDALITVGHISEQYTVNLTRNMQDEARIKFASDMAAAARGRRPNDGDIFITATRDPELQKKEAELAEKERMKAVRRRENIAARLTDSRGGGYRSGFLSVGGLEERGKGAGGARKRGATGGAKPKRRRAEYDSDDDLPAGSRRQDEYDREDDFIAPSDDDAMSGVEDEEEEDILDDEDEDEAPRKKRQKTAESEEDADADADLDDIDAPAPAHKGGRRRNIIDEDEDE